MQSLSITVGECFLSPAELTMVSNFVNLTRLEIICSFEKLSPRKDTKEKLSDSHFWKIFQYVEFPYPNQLAFFRNCRKLEKLNLNKSPITTENLQEIMSQNISDLEIDYTLNLNVNTIKILSKFRNIKKLSIRGCPWINSENLVELSACFPGLKRLVVSENNLSNTMIEKIYLLLPYTDLVIT